MEVEHSTNCRIENGTTTFTLSKAKTEARACHLRKMHIYFTLARSTSRVPILERTPYKRFFHVLYASVLRGILNLTHVPSSIFEAKQKIPPMQYCNQYCSK